MKDAYSFDRDEAGARESFERNRGAYRRIFDRCALRDVRRPGGERDHGRQAQRGLPRAGGSGENMLVSCENGDYARRSRDRAGGARGAGLSRDAGRAGGGGDTRRGDDRGARRVPRHRPRRDVEGDAGSRGRRHARARARPRRRPPLARRSSTTRSPAPPGLPPTRRFVPRSAREAARSAPSSFEGRDPRRRDAARGPVRRRSESRRLAPTRGRGGSRLRAGVRRPPRAPRRRRMRRVRWRAAVPHGDRGRPHLQLRHLLLGAAEGDVPGRGRPRAAAASAAATEPGLPGSWRPSSSSITTSAGSCGRVRLLPTTCTSCACPGWRSRRRRSSSASRQPVPQSCSTTGSSGPARSSPTPISSAARIAITRRQEDARGRRGRRARPADWRGAAGTAGRGDGSDVEKAAVQRAALRRDGDRAHGRDAA